VKVSPRITADEVRRVLSYSLETGVFVWRQRMSNAVRAGTVAGSDHQGYVRINIRGQRVFAHVLAVLYVTGEWPSAEVDHRDTNRANNRWENLRIADAFSNAQNQRRPHSNNTVGLLGVRRNHKGYQARITVGGKRLCLGTRADAEQAFALYVDAKRQLHPGNTL